MLMQRIWIPLLTLLLWAPGGSAQQEPLRLELNIPTSRLVVYEGDAVIRTYPVSVGMPGHDTPHGQFAISHAEWNPWWRPPEREWARGEKVTPPGPNNPMGRVKLFFQPLYFIHGTPDQQNIGRPASHGCIRMLNRDVIALSRLLHERAAPQVGPAEIDRILSRSKETRRVNFQESIPFLITYNPIVIEDDVLRVYPDVYRRNAVHAEGVYQALHSAGYDIRSLRHDDVKSLVQKARASKQPFTIKVAEAFGDELLARRPTAATR